MKLTYFLAASLLLFTSCPRDKECPTNLIIDFSHTIDNLDIVLGNGCVSGGDCLPDHSCCIGGDLLPYTNSMGEEYNIQTLKYLISDIVLHKENGENDTIKQVHYIDVSDLSTLFFDAGEIENGEFTNISFTMGLDTSKNITNKFINEPFHGEMAWPDIMGGGYHYMKIEGDFDTITQGYATHTGGTMGMDYSFKKNFEISLITLDETRVAEIHINMEVNNWYQNPDDINLESSIMGNMMKQMKLQSNGNNDVFTVHTHIE